ncbi:hypothetical protein AAKU55_001638 [Oxalobacteraceae bacterium GrIS 1.11]
MTRRALSAALLALLLSSSAGAVELGRLFATPAERAALDAQRADAPPDTPAAAGAAAQPVPGAVASAAATAPAAEPLVLNGVVRRSSGKSTVWLNQVPQNDANNRLGADAALSLQLSSGRKVILKPGQSFDVNNGTIKEADGR